MSEGGSMVTLTYLGSERVIPNYNVMGVAKAALEASTRYMAADSDLGLSCTGETHHVDGGFHAIGMPQEEALKASLGIES